MESHRAETTKQSSTPVETPESGLRAFVSRPTIAEEIAAVDVSKVAHIDLHEEIARDHINDIVEGRSEKLSSFHDAVKAAAAGAVADPTKVAADLIRSGIDPQEAARRALA